MIHLGRFRGAQELMRLLQDSSDAKPGGWLDRLGGELRLHHGDVVAAADANARRASLFDATGSLKMTVELRVNEARLRALIDPASPVIDQAVELATSHGMLWEVAAAWCVKALAEAGDANAVRHALAEATAAQAAGSHRRAYPFTIAESFDAAVRRDERRLAEIDAKRARGGWDARWRRPLEWWRAWALDDEPPRFDDVEWLESQTVVRWRWLSIIEARRAQLGLR